MLASRPPPTKHRRCSCLEMLCTKDVQGRGCSNVKLERLTGSNMSMAMDTKEDRATSSAHRSISGQANINVAVVHGVVFNEVSPKRVSVGKGKFFDKW